MIFDCDARLIDLKDLPALCVRSFGLGGLRMSRETAKPKAELPGLSDLREAADWPVGGGLMVLKTRAFGLGLVIWSV